MRATMTISLPAKLKKLLLERAKREKTSVSSIIIKALKYEETLISEDELLAIVKETDKAHRAGKTKILKSLADLMD